MRWRCFPAMLMRREDASQSVQAASRELICSVQNLKGNSCLVLVCKLVLVFILSSIMLNHQTMLPPHLSKISVSDIKWNNLLFTMLFQSIMFAYFTIFFTILWLSTFGAFFNDTCCIIWLQLVTLRCCKQVKIVFPQIRQMLNPSHFLLCFCFIKTKYNVSQLVKFARIGESCRKLLM